MCEEGVRIMTAGLLATPEGIFVFYCGGRSEVLKHTIRECSQRRAHSLSITICTLVCFHIHCYTSYCERVYNSPETTYVVQASHASLCAERIKHCDTFMFNIKSTRCHRVRADVKMKTLANEKAYRQCLGIGQPLHTHLQRSFERSPPENFHIAC